MHRLFHSLFWISLADESHYIFQCCYWLPYRTENYIIIGFLIKQKYIPYPVSFNLAPCFVYSLLGFLSILILRCFAWFTKKKFTWISVQRHLKQILQTAHNTVCCYSWQFLFGSAHVMKQLLFRQACELAFAECDAQGDNYCMEKEVSCSFSCFPKFVLGFSSVYLCSFMRRTLT